MTDQNTEVTFVKPDAAPQPTTVEPLGEGYRFHDVHNQEWNLVVHVSDNTPIAKAWARLLDRGVDLGPPLGDVYAADDDTLRQRFGLATAEFKNKADNFNQIVAFHDARGFVGHESGL